MVGSKILHYEILELLGRGAMGVVYKARDTRLDTFRALKFLHLELSSLADTHDHFLREARTQAQLMHPNIAALLALEIADDATFLVMEYVDGIPLDVYLREENPPVRDRIGILMQVARALEAAHARGIIHRDIKPSNVLMTRDGTAKVTDFGLAKSIGQTELSRTGETKGSVFYMPPEAFKGGRITTAADVWALGVLTYAVLEGEPPFRGEVFEAIAYAIIQEPHAILSARYRQALPGIDSFLEACLHKDPAERMPSGREALTGLQAVAQNAGFEDLLRITLPVTTPRPVRRRGRRISAAAGAIALAAIATVVAMLLIRHPPPRMPVLLLEQSALADESDPSWSPDGIRFAYIQGLQQETKSLVIRSLQDGVPPVVEELPSDLSVGQVYWSPCEEVVALNGASGLFLFHLETQVTHQLTDYPAQQPSWSSDGQWLIWGNQSTEHSFLEQVGPIDPTTAFAGGELIPQLIDFGDVAAFDISTSYYCPVFILEDTKIAFVASRLADNLGIWMLDPASGTIEPIMAGEPYRPWDLDWNEGGHVLFFKEDMGTEIFRVPLDADGHCDGEVRRIELAVPVSGFDLDPANNRLALLTTTDSYHIWQSPLTATRRAFTPLITRYYQTLSPMLWKQRNAIVFSAVDTPRGVNLDTYDVDAGEKEDLHPPSDQYGNEYSPTIDPAEGRFIVFLGVIGSQDTGLLYYDAHIGQIGVLLKCPPDGGYLTPHWSSDGEEIFMIFSPSDRTRDREIHRMRVNRTSSGIRAGEIRSVLVRPHISAPQQSADGRFLIIDTLRENRRFLDLVDLTTIEVRPFTEGSFPALDTTRRDLYFMQGSSVWRIRDWAEQVGREVTPERIVDLPRGVNEMGFTNPMCINDTAVYALLHQTNVGQLRVYQLPR